MVGDEIQLETYGGWQRMDSYAVRPDDRPAPVADHGLALALYQGATHRLPPRCRRLNTCPRCPDSRHRLLERLLPNVFVHGLGWDTTTKIIQEPEKKIKSRYTHFQLTSIGPIQAGAGGTAAQHASVVGRTVYVSNVHADANSEKQKSSFAKFGEIEAGTFGFDMNMRSREGWRCLFTNHTRGGEDAPAAV